jgi:hypothetical protein
LVEIETVYFVIKRLKTDPIKPIPQKKTEIIVQLDINSKKDTILVKFYHEKYTTRGLKN